MTFDKVKEILVEYKDCDEAEVTMEATFEGLGLDSLDTVELVMNIEEEFGITINMDEPVKSVSELVALIDQLKTEA